MSRNTTFFLFIICLLFSIQSYTQTITPQVLPGTFNIGGGTANISPEFRVDWSIGESTVIDTWFGENNQNSPRVGLKWNVTNGILQPFDKNQKIFDATILFWTPDEIRLFPVPTRDVVSIDFRSFTTGKISIDLLTWEGKLLANKEFNQVNDRGIHSFNLRTQPSGTYFFKIMLTSPNGSVLKQGLFKFEKIQ